MKVLPIHNMQGIRVFRNTWRRLAMACRPACVAAAFLAMTFAPACTKSETVPDSGSGTEDPYMMPMTLSVSAEMMNGTKALIEPDDFQIAGNQIRVFDKLTIDGNFIAGIIGKFIVIIRQLFTARKRFAVAVRQCLAEIKRAVLT